MVKEAFVSYDRETGKPRGFGFVVFENPTVAERVVQNKHTIDRREVDAKHAMPRTESAGSRTLQRFDDPANSVAIRKIFVGGLPPGVTDAVLRQHFEQCGPVEDAIVMMDHHSKRSRGFGFVTFVDEATVEAVIRQHSRPMLQGKTVEVKRAVPRGQLQGGQPARQPVSSFGSPYSPSHAQQFSAYYQDTSPYSLSSTRHLPAAPCSTVPNQYPAYCAAEHDVAVHEPQHFSPPLGPQHSSHGVHTDPQWPMACDLPVGQAMDHLPDAHWPPDRGGLPSSPNMHAMHVLHGVASLRAHSPSYGGSPFAPAASSHSPAGAQHLAHGSGSGGRGAFMTHAAVSAPTHHHPSHPPLPSRHPHGSGFPSADASSVAHPHLGNAGVCGMFMPSEQQQHLQAHSTGQQQQLSPRCGSTITHPSSGNTDGLGGFHNALAASLSQLGSGFPRD